VVCVALSPSIDVTYLVGHLRPGTIHRPHKVFRVAGGKGFNVARTAHTLGADVVASGVLGGDSGAWLLAMLARTGMRLATVAASKPTRVCVSVADETAGTLTEFYEPIPSLTPKAWNDLKATVVRLCDEHPSWVCLSGSMPPRLVPEALGDLVTAAKDAGARVAVDTHSTALAATGGAGADLLKVNLDEAVALLGAGPGTGYGGPLEGTEDPVALAAKVLDAAPHTSLAIVTAGAGGAVAAPRSGQAVRVCLDVQGNYPMGSGDCFLGGLLAALAYSPDDLPAALRLAAGAGAANALVPGAGVLDAGTARELATKVRLAPATAS
jgi:1-phosphofructokinase/tagatose 6-phosphate kinase